MVICLSKALAAKPILLLLAPFKISQSKACVTVSVSFYFVGLQLQVAAYIYKYNIILRLDAYIYNINIYTDAYIYNNIILTNKVVIIPSAMMFCHWVVDMDTIHLPLHRLPQGLV